jgi:Holliday junction resolvase
MHVHAHNAILRKSGFAPVRRAAKRDASEPAIVQALQACGFAVERVSDSGQPDLLLSRAGRWYVAEAKSRYGKLTPAQERMHARARAEIPIFRTAEDAIQWANSLAT